MTIKIGERKTIVVVDAKESDYKQLVRCPSAENWSFKFLSTGRQALRFRNTDSAGCWIINMHLADFNGPDLFQMLRRDLDGTPTFLVSDRYRVEYELEAYSVSAAAYFPKPLDELWLNQWVNSTASNSGEVSPPRQIRTSNP